jgi:hypothetical protein
MVARGSLFVGRYSVLVIRSYSKLEGELNLALPASSYFELP